MSAVKKEGNIKLERKLYFLDGMANLLLNQIKDIKSEAESLLDYSKEDLNFYIDNKSGYFNNTINSTNLEKNLIIMNDDLNYLNNNLNSLQNIIDTSFSNINGTDTEFNAYLQN